MSSLGEMAGSIAHEINTPLAIIQLSAEQLEDPELRSQLTPDEISSIALTMSSTVQRVAKIVKGLKAFARNADQDPREEIRLNDVLEETLELCREKFKNNGIELKTDIDQNIRVACRATQLSQVYLNLLSNAIDAVSSGHGSKENWVRVEARDLGDKVVIKMIDSGRGIPQEIAERILEPFFTTKPFGQGTGLGLSISKGLIESHSGRLYLDRDHERTCFVVELPAPRSQKIAV